MEFTLDYASLAKKLESQELESPSGRASAQVYGQLLAIYLLFNDLTSAKFLWKRIPDDIKQSNTELSVIWAVGKLMWQKNYSDIYQTINSCPTWPNHLKNIMKLITESTRQRVTSLIGRAYSTIRLSDASSLLGLTSEETLSLAQAQGWTFETDTGFIITNQGLNGDQKQHDKIIQCVPSIDSGTELIEKLTDCIIFLDSAR